jgi:hypothetical protein
MEDAGRGMNKVGSRGQLCIGWHTHTLAPIARCLLGMHRSAQAQDEGCGGKYLTMHAEAGLLSWRNKSIGREMAMQQATGAK